MQRVRDADRPRPYALLQSTVASRWDWLRLVETAFLALGRNSGPSDLAKVLRVRDVLGRGEYAVVRAARLLNAGLPFDIAVKEMIVPASTDRVQIVRRLTQLLREEIAYAYLNSLVLLRIAPGFSLLHGAFLSRQENHAGRRDMEFRDCERVPPAGAFFYYCLAMERADGDLAQWLREDRGDDQLMSCALQVCMSCAAMALHLQLVNNDLYPKNILFNRTLDRSLRYHLAGRTFVADSHGFVFKLSDFGICSSPTFLENSHESATRFFRARLPVPMYESFDYGRHVLEYEGVPSYCRDVLVFLRALGMAARRLRRRATEAWTVRALRYLQKCASSGWMSKPDGLILFVVTIFSSEFREASLLSEKDSGIRCVSPEASATWDDREDGGDEFDLHGTRETRKAILCMAQDRLRIANLTSAE